MSEVRWGFVGGGNVTESKASPDGAFTQERSRVVAVARTDLVRSQAYARQYGIARAYATVDEVCTDPEVDAVFVCTPHHLHTQHALAAIKAGKHVLCEKPLTITTREGLEVVEAAEKAGVTLGVAYYRRFYPVMEMLRAVVRSNRLGTITAAEVVRSTYSVPKRPAAGERPAWRGVIAEAGGGVLADGGSHRVDLLFWLFGDASSVSGSVKHVETWTESEDQANIMIQFANGVTATMHQSACSRSERDTITLYGSEGIAKVEDLEGSILTLQIGSDVETLEVSPHAQATHRPLVEDFVRSVLDGGPVRVPGSDALRTTQLIELAYAAARHRQTLEIPDPSAHRSSGPATIPLPLVQIPHNPQKPG